MKTVVIVVLAIAVGALGYWAWQETQTDAVSITVGEDGVDVDAQ